jgi:hypothetical protein
MDDGRIVGATTDTLTIANVNISDEDVYDVVVTLGTGSIVSDPAVLGVRSSACPGDTDGSGNVDFNDLVSTLFLFGPCPE